MIWLMHGMQSSQWILITGNSVIAVFRYVLQQNSQYHKITATTGACKEHFIGHKVQSLWEGELT